jgi:spore maturation protein SpmB
LIVLRNDKITARVKTFELVFVLLIESSTRGYRMRHEIIPELLELVVRLQCRRLTDGKLNGVIRGIFQISINR